MGLIDFFFFKFCILYLHVGFVFFFISNKDTVVHVHTMYTFALNLLHVTILLHLIDCAKQKPASGQGQSERVCILHLRIGRTSISFCFSFMKIWTEWNCTQCVTCKAYSLYNVVFIQFIMFISNEPNKNNFVKKYFLSWNNKHMNEIKLSVPRRHTSHLEIRFIEI